MTSAIELREQRAKLVNDCETWYRSAQDENKPGDEVDAEFGRRMADIDALAEQIKEADRAEKLVNVRNDLNKPLARKVEPAPSVITSRTKEKNSRNEYRSALRNWLLQGTEDEDRSDAARNRGSVHGLPLGQRSFSFSIADEMESRTMLQYGSAGTGVELAPPNLPSGFVYWAKQIAPILNYVSLIQTSDTRDIPYPIVEDNAVGTIVPEANLIPDADFTTSTKTFKAWKYASKIQKVSIEFLKSSVGNIEGTIGRMLADRIAKAFAVHSVADDSGAAQPQGLRHAAGTASVVLGTRGTLTSDALLDLIYSVDEPFVNNGTFMMNRATIAAVRKMKDGQGNYLWQESFQQGEPARIAGYPVLLNDNMPTLATAGAQKVVLFGDLRQYTVRTAGPVTVNRSDDRYMEYGLVAFSALQFLDARFTGPAGALKALGNPAS